MLDCVADVQGMTQDWDFSLGYLGATHETFQLVITYLCTMNLHGNPEFGSHCLIGNRR